VTPERRESGKDYMALDVGIVRNKVWLYCPDDVLVLNCNNMRYIV